MYKETRLFPRYSVTKLEPVIKLEGLIKKEFKLLDVSLLGIKIQTQNKIQLNGINLVKVHLIKSKEYSLNIQQRWIKETQNGYLCGFEISFLDVSSYQDWKKLILALHLKSYSG